MQKICLNYSRDFKCPVKGLNNDTERLYRVYINGSIGVFLNMLIYLLFIKLNAAIYIWFVKKLFNLRGFNIFVNGGKMIDI